MSDHAPNFVLPRNIEKYLVTLSKLYAHDGKQQMQALIVNSQIRVHEKWSSDNWNGGTYGHALFLIVPEVIYLDLAKQKDKIQKQIQDDINKIHNVQDEFIAEVFMEMESLENSNWKQESGLLLTRKISIKPDTEKRIWGEVGFRAFLSHKVDVKIDTALLKKELNLFGISCFVAHEDIPPTHEWQNEIENALSSMDVLIALMTENFHESDWTDQEVGYALGQGIQVVPVKLGRDPYGFIGKFQAVSCVWQNASLEIAKVLIKHEGMKSAYIKALSVCSSWDSANRLAELLPSIVSLSEVQIQLIIEAYKNNSDINGSFGFKGNTRKYGSGLAFHLERLTGNKYTLS